MLANPQGREIIHGSIEYVRMSDIKKVIQKPEQIPFVKRYPYRNEEEYRVICESKRKVARPSLNLPRTAIRKVTINQFLPREIFELIKQKIEVQWNVPVNQSTIIKNTTWINHMNKL